MSNKQISQLPSASRNALDTDQIAIDDLSNLTKKLTGLEIKDYILTEPRNLFLAMNDPTGFPNITDSVITFSDSSPDRTLTIQPAVTSFDFYVKGIKFTKSGAETKQITAVEGTHYIYYDNAGALQSIVNPTQQQIDVIIRESAIISIIYWDATNLKHIYFAEERHGMQMDGATHSQQHFTEGTQFISGAALNSILADQDGSLDTHAQFGVDLGSIQDEDLNLSNSAVVSTIGLPVYYKLGASGNWRQQINAGFSVLTTGTGRLAWNEFTGGAWQQTEVINGHYVLAHIFSTNDKDNPYIAILGQNDYLNQPQARLGANTEISNLITEGLPFEEFVPIASVIFQTDDSYTNSVKARIRTTDLGADYVDFRFTKISPLLTSVNDHGNLTGLVDDDHLQYALLAGRTGDILKIDTITEYTSDNGITIEGMLHKDNTINNTSLNTVLANESTFFGFDQNQNGQQNCVFGYRAGQNLGASSLLNSFFGFKAGNSCINQTNNTYIGAYAGELSSGGSYNTYIGMQAGRQNTNGDRNVSIGWRSAIIATGSQNVVIGYSTGYEAVNNNVMIGYEAGFSNNNSSNIFIGHQAGYNELGSNKLYIENSNISTPLIYGEFDNDLIRINGDLDITDDLKIDTITEYTTDAGVNIEGAIFEDTTLHLNDTETPALFSTATIQAFKNTGVDIALWTASAVANADSDITLVRSRGTIGSQAACQDNDFLGSINFVGETDGSNFNYGAQIRVEVNGAVSTGILPADLVFYTNPGGGATQEAMRLDKNKNLNINGDLDVIGDLAISSHTTISEVSNETVIYNDTDEINIKLSDNLGLRKFQILDSGGTPVGYINSDGEIESSIGSDGVLEVKNSSALTKAKINSVGDSFVIGGNFGFGISTPSTLVEIETALTEGDAGLTIDQNDNDEPFINYEGTSAADQTKNISTVNGDGAVEGPKNYSSSAGWAFEGMVRININGTDYWMPYYSADVA